MKLTNKEKLQMCLEHLNDGKSLQNLTVGGLLLYNYFGDTNEKKKSMP